MFELKVENKQPLVVGAVLLVIALAAWAIYMNLHSSRTVSQPKLIKELNAVLAQAVLQAVGDHGQIVLVTEAVDQSGGPGTGDRRELDKYAAQLQTQLDDFRQALHAHPGVVIAGTERVTTELSSAGQAGTGMSAAGSYYSLAKKYPDAAAIVSFTDAPNLDPADLRRLPKRLPKIITVASTAAIPNLYRLVEAGVLQAAILPRWKPLAADAQPRPPDEQMARSYQIVTPANIDALLNPPALK